MRLDKAVSMTGLSRANAKELIKAGRVCIRGEVSRDPGDKCELGDVTIDGVALGCREHIYIAVNKPHGVVTATKDSKYEVISDLLPDKYRHRNTFPAGRLDRDATGLVLMTDDGELAHRIISPRYESSKRYVVEAEGMLPAVAVEEFRAGMDLGDFITRPAGLRILTSSDERTTAEVVLTEGKFHQIKRMFHRIGNDVISLKRVSIGPIELGDMEPGECRELTDSEVISLLAYVGMK